MVVCTSVSPAQSLIITCASSKGGVGKSTSCACLAGALAHLGETVHIADLDSNQTVSRWFQDDKTRPRAITVSTPDPQNLTGHLQEIGSKIAPDFILIDVAGSYERALTVAAARAHLTIIPATLTEADVYEAEKTARHIEQIFASFGREPLFRLLLTKVQPLQSHGQRHAAREIRRKQLPLLGTVLVQRAAYEEIGLSGLPPHYADNKRETVAKAVAELNALRDEVIILVRKRELKIPALFAAGAA
jgi:chromosome partitioning protein